MAPVCVVNELNPPPPLHTTETQRMGHAARQTKKDTDRNRCPYVHCNFREAAAMARTPPSVAPTMSSASLCPDNCRPHGSPWKATGIQTTAAVPHSADGK